ncbi:MAG: hypothetical protein ACR2O8_16950 [Rhizobiaceae bacterium]
MKYLNLGFVALLTIMIGLFPIAGLAPVAAQENDLGTLQDLLPPPANPDSPRSVSARIRVFDNILIHQLPVWSSYANGPAPAERSIIQTATNNGVYRMKMAPADENFEDWTNLFSIVALNQPNAPIQKQAEDVANYYRSICSPSNMQMFRGNQSANRFVFVIVCGNYSRQREIGQMAAVTIFQNRNVAVTLTRQWRGKAFQSSIDTNWPVKKQEVDAVLKELVRTRLVPINSN